MYTSRYYTTPFRLGSNTDFSPEPPRELSKHFLVAEKVSRYRFTEEESNFIFQDNVMTHTKRLVNYLHNLHLPDFLDRAVIERMLWLHDIPEAIVNEVRGSDYVTHEKHADEELSNSQDSQEESVARLVFSENDYRLFLNTENSKPIIKEGKWSDPDFSSDAIFAKMLDWIDGRSTFAGVVTQWMMSESYASNPILPPDGTFELCFLQSYQTWMNNFDTLPESDFREFMLHFIHDEYYHFYVQQWNTVRDRFPFRIRAMYDHFVASDFFAKTR